MEKGKGLRYMPVRMILCFVLGTVGFWAGAKKVCAGTSNIAGMSAGAGGMAEVFSEDRDTAGALADGRYAVEVELSGGSGKASVVSPTLMIAEEGKYYAQITWSSSHYDYMMVSEEKYDNQAEDGANSTFVIPILAFDEEMPVLADTLAMGEPHEIPYTLYFYSDSVGSESSLPQEGAKRVLIMAVVIIVAGGILNYFVNQRRKRDYSGGKRCV